MSGPVEAEVMMTIRQEQIARMDKPLLSRFHNIETNNGTAVAAKVPAKIGCRKGP